jgi:hypothetical protein
MPSANDVCGHAEMRATPSSGATFVSCAVYKGWWAMKRYKYCALVKLEPAEPGQRGGPPLPEAGGRVVVRAHHHETHRSKMFSALVTTTHGEQLQAADHSIQLTMTVLGDDACDYLEAGDTFALWRGHDIGQGVISRRLFLWADSP